MDDVRITGGRLYDPGSGLDRDGDLAVRAGRIVAVGDPGELEDTGAYETVDARGLLVTPGLIDMHTHIHAGGSFWGIEPDPVAWYTGVTTWVDAGSAGAFGLDGFARRMREYRVRARALVHVSAIGLTGRTGESRDPANLDVDAAIAAIARNRDVAVGIKVRIDNTAVGDQGLLPLQRGLEVADATGLPVMVHIGRAPVTLDVLVRELRPGDIVTHCAGPAARGLLEPGAVRDELQAAYERGVVFDIGHGAGGFTFEVFEEYLRLGMPPHVVSSDLHALCQPGPAFDLSHVMDKLVAAGMPLRDVVARTTAAPAATLGLDGGSLVVGAPADLALVRLVDEPHEYGDVLGARRHGEQRIRVEATYVGGRRLPPAFPPPPPSWVPLSDGQRAALARREDALRDILQRPLVGPDDVQNQIPEPVPNDPMTSR